MQSSLFLDSNNYCIFYTYEEYATLIQWDRGYIDT